MTAAPALLTCTAVFPLPGAARPHCDRLIHEDRMHTACVQGVPFAWSDADHDGLDEWEQATVAKIRAAYGDDMSRTDAARLEAIGSALVTLRAHRWLGHTGDDIDVQRCGCGWTGVDHERHTAAQLYATGALDRHAPPVVDVVRAATALVGRLRARASTNEMRALVNAVTVVQAIGEGS